MSPSEEAAINATSIANNYELICEIKVDDRIPVMKYKSKRTGVHVIVAKVDGPLVSGYFTLGIIIFL